MNIFKEQLQGATVTLIRESGLMSKDGEENKMRTAYQRWLWNPNTYDQSGSEFSHKHNNEINPALVYDGEMLQLQVRR